MNKFDIILWDLDNTLLDFTESERYSITECFSRAGLSIDDSIIETYSAINLDYWKRLEKGEVTKEALLYGRFFSLFEKLNLTEVDIPLFQKTYQHLLGSVYFYKDDSYRLCEKLKDQYRQYIVTNGVKSTQENKLSISGFDKLMDGVFISEEIGYPKPDIRFFEKCFETIKPEDRSRVIIIGDSLSSDMKGGNQVDIATCWYNPEETGKESDIRVDFEIKHLWQIEDILKEG